MEQRREVHAGADEEDAGALRGVHLVAGEGEQVYVLEGASRSGLPRSRGSLAAACTASVWKRMDGVVGLGDAGQLADGLDGAGLVVGEHDGDELGVGAESGFEGCGVDEAFAVGSEVGYV